MKKKVFFFHPSSELYGADKILIYVMKNFPNYEKNLVLKEKGPLVDFLRKECPDITIHVIATLPIIAKKNFNPSGLIKFLSSFFLFKREINKLNKEQPNIVYLNTLAVIPIFFFYKYPVKIVHIHEILKNNNLLHRLINKIALKKADALICVSKAVSNNLSEIASPLEKEKIKLVHNGIKFTPKITKSDYIFNVDETLINFALIGRIKPTHKGQNLLLDAIAKLPQEYLSRSHFYFVGSVVSGQEYMKDEVIDKINKLKLSEKVTIVPFVEEIEEIYRKMDVVVVPSVFDDPFPTTVLEAMFWEKPVIGTKVGGIPEMIVNNQTGFLVNRDDADDLASKILFFLDNKASILQMGKNGRKHFEENFSEDSFIYNYNSCLESIL